MIRQELIDEVVAIVFLKSLCIKYQSYEIAAHLRETEKEFYVKNDINESEIKSYIQKGVSNINQYNHTLTILNKIKNGPFDDEDFIKESREDIQHIVITMRSKKIDEILT